MLSPRLKQDALVQHHGDLRWLADEQLEGIVLLVEGGQGHCVGVKVESKSKSVPGSLLRPYLLGFVVPLHLWTHQLDSVSRWIDPQNLGGVARREINTTIVG